MRNTFLRFMPTDATMGWEAARFDSFSREGLSRILMQFFPSWRVLSDRRVCVSAVVFLSIRFFPFAFVSTLGLLVANVGGTD